MTNLNQETQNFIQELKLDPNIIGIILFGSWARGNNRPDSDVDLIIIQKEGYQRKIEKRGKQVFEIIAITPESAMSYWKDHKDDAYGVWQVAQILFDKDRIVEKLKQEILQLLEKGKAPINQLQKEQFHFDATDQIDYVEKIMEIDTTTARLILNNKVFDLTQKFFDLKQLWIPAKKQILKEIQKVDNTLFILFESFYAERDLDKQIAIARQIINIVFS